jgi:hypothetical protein
MITSKLGAQMVHGEACNRDRAGAPAAKSTIKAARLIFDLFSSWIG